MSTFQEYMKEMVEFFHKHGDFTVTTSDMKHDKYMKTYTFADGATWYEVCGSVFEKVEAEVRGVKVSTTVRLFRVEYWNSEAGSKFYYEKY